jgi:ketosteroid isomerase-like protein
VYFDSAAAAESAFYGAFSSGDHAEMMRVWASNGDVVCVHPMGPRLIGRDLIAASWEQILAGAAPRSFEIQLKATWGTTELAVHVVDEIISVPKSELQFAPVLATNVYKVIGGSWYMTAHHASIDASRSVPITMEEEAQTRH